MSTAPESNPHMQRAQTFFQYGNDAALKGNLPYAIDMYRNACKLVPDALLFRQALRGVERRQFNNDPAKVGRFVGTKVQPIRLKARSSKSKGQWANVLEICEEAFVHNPWDVATATDAAEAAENLGYKELAQWYLESVQAQAGNDAGFYRTMAHVYQLNENWQKAIACWERVKKIAPNDEDARRQINALSASATISRARLGEAIDKHATSGPEKALPSEAEDLKPNKLSPGERLEKEIQERPDRVGPYLDLSELLRKKNQLDEAREALARGLKAIPDDPVLLEAYADLQMSRVQKAIESWKKRAQEDPKDDQAKAKLEQLTAKLRDYELAEFRRRVAQRPEDLNLRFELGLRLARAGQHGAAIAEFQQCRSSPALKVKALLQAGQSFEANGVPKLAERTYQEALKAVEPEEQSLLNELHYRLGRVAEAVGNLDAAEEHYNEVAANDYGYLDVAQRLQNLNQQRSG
jgi:tetratricopeptide (TPR) repeat protein